ncbi:unnamed protein product [Spirodela intermedia]|uniref:Uncharacterized protein n=1 Tax=Spirodela intermedia TaxID=51605 RepID=A0A7I8IQD7_SPIIN|nr:unnamed protein product [Spirodela intermedia]CAA6659795.1 unnamed protein product [Spirodela intermedia]
MCSSRCAVDVVASAISCAPHQLRRRSLIEISWIIRIYIAKDLKIDFPKCRHISEVLSFGRVVVQCPRPRRLSLDKDDVGNL